MTFTGHADLHYKEASIETGNQLSCRVYTVEVRVTTLSMSVVP